MCILERKRDKIVENYNLLSEKVLFSENVSDEDFESKLDKTVRDVHDDIWNKVTEICWLVMFINRKDPNCEYKEKVISHEDYILSVMSELKNKFGNLLEDLDLEFFKFNSLDDISEFYIDKASSEPKTSMAQEIDLF